jgi:UDP-2-acetamido-2,6-beta-L-arabino-hexul-4-ose reductase
MATQVCAVTGASGLLGWHAAIAAKFKHVMDIRCDTRAMWREPGAIGSLIDGADSVLHFAALNRAPDDSVTSENTELTDIFVTALDNAVAKPKVVVFSNSTHSVRDTAYGAMKRAVSARIAEACDRHRVIFIDAILPNVFGECGKPFSNSAVHTFCRKLADGDLPQVDGNTNIQLIHAGEVCDRIFREIAIGGLSRNIEMTGAEISVPSLADMVTKQFASYKAGIFPDVSGAFELQIFNTLRSFLVPGHYPIPLTVRADNRGELAECLKSAGGGGQVFYSSTKPGITRGNHFHFGKVERFLVLEGDAEIRIRKVLSGDTHAFKVSGKTPVAIDMPTLHTHNITNIGDKPVITLFWTHEIFDPEAPDTYADTV